MEHTTKLILHLKFINKFTTHLIYKSFIYSGINISFVINSLQIPSDRSKVSYKTKIFENIIASMLLQFYYEKQLTTRPNLRID